MSDTWQYRIRVSGPDKDHWYEMATKHRWSSVDLPTRFWPFGTGAGCFLSVEINMADRFSDRLSDLVVDYGTVPLGVVAGGCGFIGYAAVSAGLWVDSVPWCLAALMTSWSLLRADYLRRSERRLLLERIRRAEARLIACDERWGMEEVNKAIDAYLATHDEPRMPKEPS